MLRPRRHLVDANKNDSDKNDDYNKDKGKGTV